MFFLFVASSMTFPWIAISLVPEIAWSMFLKNATASVFQLAKVNIIFALLFCGFLGQKMLHTHGRPERFQAR